MLKAKRTLIGMGVLVVCGAILTPPGMAAELIVDDFSEAFAPPGTLRGDPASNVLVDTANTTLTGTDMNVAGVLGGYRVLNVSVTTCMFCPGFDNAIAGVIPEDMLLDYAASAGADGSFELVYDAGGVGFDVSAAFATGIRLRLRNLDAYPLSATITITSGANSAVSMLTLPNGPIDNDLDFPFANFTGIAGIDLEHISTIRIAVNPNGGEAAADLQMLGVTTYGTLIAEPPDDCQNGEDDDNDGVADCLDPDCVVIPECKAPAPALSPGMMVCLLGVLIATGLAGMVRMRKRLD